MKSAGPVLLLLLLPSSVCGSAQCPLPPQGCFYGLVKDGCGCCVVCAAGEGEDCGGSGGSGGSGGGPSCGEGLRCEGRGRSACVCASHGPVCGSDGRTYPSICRLTAENRRAEMEGTPPVILIQRGACDSGKVVIPRDGCELKPVTEWALQWTAGFYLFIYLTLSCMNYKHLNQDFFPEYTVKNDCRISTKTFYSSLHGDNMQKNNFFLKKKKKKS
uniref:IGFBP N-terminal domain-containing protein n=1 Tax=Sphaeramia orbicularis TaxID=375764 RepID=A0A672YYP8_9TELE